MVQPAAVKRWKRTAAYMAIHAGVKRYDGNVAMSVTLCPKINKDGTANKRRLDVDNVLKITLDALNGIAYKDDKQVVEVISKIGYPVVDGGLQVEVNRA
jgi:crossover junction endodeoxyribonuclease RusA